MKATWWAKFALLIVLCVMTALLPALAAVAAYNRATFGSRINECIATGGRDCK